MDNEALFWAIFAGFAVLTTGVIVLLIAMPTLRVWWRFDRPAKVEAWKVRIVNRLPAWVVYHCLIRAWANATRGPWSGEQATHLLVNDMIRRWESTQGGSS